MQEGPGLRTWQFTEDGTRVICVTNITEDGIDFSRLSKYISENEYCSNYRHFTVAKRDVLLSSSGNSWGKVAVYEGDEKVILNTSTIRLNELPSLPLNKEFIEVFLRSEVCREQLGLAMTGACQPNFGPTHLNEIMCPVPPSDEQVEIVDEIIRRIAPCERATAISINMINLLQERRTALIFAAVTGKIDVRNWQPEQSAIPMEASA
jgi:type I restriction enzyme S subunit